MGRRRKPQQDLSPDEIKPAKEILDGLRGTGPAFEAEDLSGFFAAFEADRDTALWALQAIALIAVNFAERNRPANCEEGEPYEGISPHHLVPIPWWVALVLGQCWLKYFEASDRTNLAQAFGIESTKAGQKSVMKRQETLQRRRNLALEVVALIEAEPGHGAVGRAIRAVADHHDLKPETVRKAYQALRRVAHAYYTTWRSQREKG